MLAAPVQDDNSPRTKKCPPAIREHCQPMPPIYEARHLWPYIGSTDERVWTPCPFSFIRGRRRSRKDDRCGSSFQGKSPVQERIPCHPVRPGSMKWSGRRLFHPFLMSSGATAPLGLLPRPCMFREGSWKKCRAENIVGGAPPFRDAHKRVCAVGTCPFEPTTFPAHA